MAKILLADDNPEIRFLTRMMLEKTGHSVAEAGDGEATLGELSREKPDLVLLDVIMPGVEGWEICRRIREGDATRDLPVVMFTVKTNEEDMKKSMECGADAHINKPFNMEELLKVVRRFLKE